MLPLTIDTGVFRSVVDFVHSNFGELIEIPKKKKNQQNATFFEYRFLFVGLCYAITEYLVFKITYEGTLSLPNVSNVLYLKIDDLKYAMRSK